MRISVDEGMIQASQLTCPIAQHIPNKPIKRGIKLYMAKSRLLMRTTYTER